MTYLQNTTGRLLHPAYVVQSPDGQKSGRYLALDSETPGVPPGSHDIDDATARLIREHPTNAMFFDTGMLKIGEGSAPKTEKTLDKGAKIFRADPQAFITKVSEKAKVGGGSHRS